MEKALATNRLSRLVELRSDDSDLCLDDTYDQ